MNNTFQDDNKLTVIHSTNVWLPRTENWLYVQLRFLPEWVENHVVCRSTTNLDQFPQPNVHAVNGAFRFRLVGDNSIFNPRMRRYAGFLSDNIRLQKASILHSHFGVIGWRNLYVAKKRGVKHVVTFYGADLGKYPTLDSRWRGRYREMFKRIDLSLCEGPHMAGLAVELGCPESKVRVHHLGVDVDNIRFQPRKWTAGETLRVLIASSFREKKGIPYALEALAEFQRDVELEATIIGDAGNEESSRLEKEKILAVIEKHNLSSKVRMMGYQTHSALFEEAYMHHVFLSPSLRASDGDIEGGTPVSIIEMAATGMPVISTRHCDIPNVIQHGEGGLLAEEISVDSIYENLKWLIANTGRWGEMALSARRRVEEHFNARLQGEKLAAIYKEIAF